MKSLVINNHTVWNDTRPAHAILDREPLRSIPLDDGLHMVIHAKEATGPDAVNGPAVSLLLSCSQLPVDAIPMVRGRAVIVRADGADVDAADLGRLAFRTLNEDVRVARDAQIFAQSGGVRQ